MKRFAGEELIQAPVERLLVLPRDHRLVAPGVVDIDDITAGNSRMKQDLIVRGPEGTQLHLPGDGDACNEYHRAS